MQNMEINETDLVLCAANSYVEKYYLNEEFSNLPQEVKDTLQIICVDYTEEIGGIFLMKFTEDGRLTLQTINEDGDYLYDEIGARLKINEIEKKYSELFEKLELFYEGLKNIKMAERTTGKSLR